MNSFIRDEYIAKKVSGLGTDVWVDRNRVRVKKWKTDPLLRMYEINQQICDWSEYDTDPAAPWDADAVKTLFIHVEVLEADYESIDISSYSKEQIIEDITSSVTPIS